MAQKIFLGPEDGDGDEALEDLQMVLHGQAKEGDRSIKEKEAHNFVSAMRRFLDSQTDRGDDVTRGLIILLAIPVMLVGFVAFAAGSIVYGVGSVVKGIGKLATGGMWESRSDTPVCNESSSSTLVTDGLWEEGSDTPVRN